MKTTPIAVCCGLLLAACGSQKDASKENFAKAINKHLSSQCIAIDPAWPLSGEGYPVSIEMEGPGQFRPQMEVDKRNRDATRKYDALVQAGVLTERSGTKRIVPLYGSGGPKDVPAKLYDLTDTGKKAQAAMGGKGTALCVGHYKVDMILSFTQPASAFNAIVSEVSYGFSPDDVVEWAKSSEVLHAFPSLQQALGVPRRGRTTVLLTSDGWVEGSEFGK
ncbi:hypothetical protein [Burkholderia ambifaria]|jgi:hypothetical protein|uniref:Putative secreted protein n=1 Tax=Burkholderia ambifaria IOP40-10 TaxID=396596 RepID=B1FMD2_9BURK|nr:hypothetical protein [Burkholderia ambifaria]EDT01286.1 putative secreted protein [Burkholderia ambifaria IOP40-10]